ncbi:MAG: hypothetical protein ACFFDW_03695 [Candidatus Thorarchaeota archaeon]
MALDIIKEQRMIRTLFYSLIKAAEQIVDDKNSSVKFSSQVEKFIMERTLIEEDTRERIEVIDELLDTLGWKSSVINFDTNTGVGKVLLGKNRYIVKELADSKGTMLVLNALMEGICYHLIGGPVKADAALSFSAGSYYEIKLSRKAQTAFIHEDFGEGKGEKSVDDAMIHNNLTLESMFQPIFGRSIPNVLLFETAWKVISETFVANHSTQADESLKEAIKNESLANLSRFIMKITEDESEEEILNVAELIGEFIVKILTTKINEPLIGKLQSTLQDRHANSYLIYYECLLFCAQKKFTNRCVFIRGMWLGILSEIYGVPMKIKEVFHAGKRDRYCMLELIAETKKES